jgi:hypothetical protein
MKLLSTIIFLISSNLLFAQDTLKNNFPTYFISQIEIRYELIDLEKLKTDFQNYGKFKVYAGLHQQIKPFSPNEFPPYFDLELSEEDIFDFQSGFEIEPLEYFQRAENNFIKPVPTSHYSTSALIISTNYDTKESVNFYNVLVDQKTFSFNNKLTFSNVIYQRQEFLRSFFEWNFTDGKRGIHFNLVYLNNLYYRHLDNTAILYGDRSHVYFPEKYHEKRNGEWGYLMETQNQNLSETAVLAKLLFSPFRKTYLKIDSDLHYFFVSENQRIRQRFQTIGIGVKPQEDTIIFLEYTNRNIIFNRNLLLFSAEEKPYLALSAKRILKLRLFKK